MTKKKSQQFRDKAKHTFTMRTKKCIRCFKKEKFTLKDRKELMSKIRKAAEKQDHNALLKLSREYLDRAG